MQDITSHLCLKQVIKAANQTSSSPPSEFATSLNQKANHPSVCTHHEVHNHRSCRQPCERHLHHGRQLQERSQLLWPRPPPERQVMPDELLRTVILTDAPYQETTRTRSREPFRKRTQTPPICSTRSSTALGAPMETLRSSRTALQEDASIRGRGRATFVSRPRAST